MEYTLTYNHQSQFIEMFGNPLFSDEDDAIELREVTEIVLGSTPNSKNERYWNGNLCWITPSELSDDSFEVANTERHISEDGAKSANLTLMPKGTVLLSTRAPIGKVALTTCPMYCNQGFKNMICTDGINNVFLYYTLKYNKNRLQSMGTGTTFKELSKKIIESIKISVPPIQAQKEFESIYRQADKSKFDGFKSQFIEMFGNPFDECSDKVSLSSLCIINPSRPKDLDDSLPVSFIPMDSISEEGEYSTFTSRPLGEVKKGFTYCADEDVLFAKITPCMENGKGAMLKELSNGIGFGSTEFHVLRPLPGVTTSTWLYNLTKLDILRKDAAKNMTGTGGQKRVPASYLETFSVLPPSIELQEEFAAISQQADKSKYYVQNKLNYICHILTKQIQLKRCS